MSEPPIAEKPAPSRSWWQRVKALFTQPVKLPGWAALLLVIFQLVPDWKSRIDFWLGVAKAGGGHLAMVATIISSPYFTPGLLVAGLAWIGFAGEPEKGVQRHHWLRYVGWSVFLICFTAIVVTIGYGAFQVAINAEVNSRDSELQRQYAIHSIFWHLTDYQKTALASAIDQVPEKQHFPISILCLPDAGSRTYVSEFAQVFIDHNWKNIQANCLFNDVRPDLIGVYIGLSTSLMKKLVGKSVTQSSDKNLLILARLLDSAKISAQWASYEDHTKDDHFYLLIGNAP